MPRNFKLNSFFILFHRAYKISLGNLSLHREFETLTKVNFNKCFPKKLVYDCILIAFLILDYVLRHTFSLLRKISSICL